MVADNALQNKPNIQQDKKNTRKQHSSSISAEDQRVEKIGPLKGFFLPKKYVEGRTSQQDEETNERTKKI